MVKKLNVKDNTVKAKGQIRKEDGIFYLGNENAQTKILVLGNSILKHARLEEIGWFGDWGMAATCKKNDFIHRLYSLLKENGFDVHIKARQCSTWEREYMTEGIVDDFATERDFKPDVLVITLGENVLPLNNEEEKNVFVEELERLTKFMAKPTTKILFKTCVWESPSVDEGIENVAKKLGARVASVSHLRENPEKFFALGKFEHNGVAMHPGDEGMKEIARVFYKTLADILE